MNERHVYYNGAEYIVSKWRRSRANPAREFRWIEVYRDRYTSHGYKSILVERER